MTKDIKIPDELFNLLKSEKDTYRVNGKPRSWSTYLLNLYEGDKEHIKVIGELGLRLKTLEKEKINEKNINYR